MCGLIAPITVAGLSTVPCRCTLTECASCGHALSRPCVCAGILIEDQVAPKSCGHVRGKRVVLRDEAVSRICAAVGAPLLCHCH